MLTKDSFNDADTIERLMKVHRETKMKEAEQALDRALEIKKSLEKAEIDQRLSVLQWEKVVTEIANSARQTGQGSQEEVTNYEVKISIKDKERFRPGMNVTAFVKTKFVSNAVLVPIQAVTARTNEPLKEEKTEEGEVASKETDKNKSFADKRDQIKNEKKLEEVVFVVKEDNTVEKRTIIKGISDDNYYRVISG